MTAFADFTTTIAFGAHEALQNILIEHLLPVVLLPSLAAMVLAAAGQFGPRDLLAVSAVPSVLATGWGLVAWAFPQLGWQHLVMRYGSSHVTMVMFVTGVLLLMYILTRTPVRLASRFTLRKIIGYAFVWTLCTSNLALVFACYNRPAILSVDYTSPVLASGWIIGNQAVLYAAFLVAPSVGGALSGYVPERFCVVTTWAAAAVFTAALVLELYLHPWPLLFSLSSLFHR